MRLNRLFLFVPLLLIAGAHAQNLTTVGIPTDEFDFVASTQQAREWCWAASTQMVLNWFDVDVRQADLVRRIKGRIVDQSATERDIDQALNGTVTLRSGKSATIHAVSVSGPADPQLIIKQLSQQNPMLLAVNTGPRSGHVCVLTAVRYHETRQGPHIDSLIVRDPYPSADNIRNQGRVEISGPALTDFVCCISRSWMIHVSGTSPRH